MKTPLIEWFVLALLRGLSDLCKWEFKGQRSWVAPLAPFGTAWVLLESDRLRAT